LKNGQNLKLGDAHASPQEISKKYKHQSLGMPPRYPFFIGKNQVTFQNTIFLWDFYFRAPGSLVVLSFPQPLNFSSVLSKPLSETVTSAGTAGCPTVEHL
jgi:hypothetical protein